MSTGRGREIHCCLKYRSQRFEETVAASYWGFHKQGRAVAVEGELLLVSSQHTLEHVL